MRAELVIARVSCVTVELGALRAVDQPIRVVRIAVETRERVRSERFRILELDDPLIVVRAILGVFRDRSTERVRGSVREIIISRRRIQRPCRRERAGLQVERVTIEVRRRADADRIEECRSALVVRRAVDLRVDEVNRRKRLKVIARSVFVRNVVVEIDDRITVCDLRRREKIIRTEQQAVVEGAAVVA